MRKKPKNHVEIIDAIGAQVLAEGLDIAYSHVRTMKTRCSIPSKYWSGVIRVATSKGVKGIDLDILAQTVGVRSPTPDETPKRTRRG